MLSMNGMESSKRSPRRCIGSLLHKRDQQYIMQDHQKDELQLQELVAYKKLDCWWYGKVNQELAPAVYAVITLYQDNQPVEQTFPKHELKRLADSAANEICARKDSNPQPTDPKSVALSS